MMPSETLLIADECGTYLCAILGAIKRKAESEAKKSKDQNSSNALWSIARVVDKTLKMDPDQLQIFRSAMERN